MTFPVFRKRGMESSGNAPDGPDATRRSSPHRVRVADRWALLAVAVIAAAASVAYGFDERWFEDDAMITMQLCQERGGRLRLESFNCGADAAGAVADGDSTDGSLRIAIPPDAQPVIKLVAHLDGQALLDEGFPASDLAIDLSHNLPQTPVDGLTITLRSNSEADPGYAAFRMARGFLPERRQHSVLSQENVFEESNFNPGNLVQRELEYAFRKQEGAPSNPWLSIEHLEVILFSGCRLSGSCISRLWER